MNKFVSIILGLPKTLRLNFCVFGIKEALVLPILVAPNVRINWKALHRGTISLLKYKPGLVNIGFYEGIGGTTSKKTIIDIRRNGHLQFSGKTCIARGSYVLIENADVCIGNNFHGGNNLKLIARKKIIVGDNVLISWDCTIMDSDGHDIYNKKMNKILNVAKDVSIGNDVWIGANVYLLKGTHIPNGCVIAAGTLLSAEELSEQCAIYGNRVNGIRLIRKEIYWKQ